jgi:hypothetical protein
LLSSEREIFNMLKNHGYNYEDKYGRVKQNLARILAVLMFLAFTYSAKECSIHSRYLERLWMEHSFAE